MKNSKNAIFQNHFKIDLKGIRYRFRVQNTSKTPQVSISSYIITSQGIPATLKEKVIFCIKYSKEKHTKSQFLTIHKSLLKCQIITSQAFRSVFDIQRTHFKTQIMFPDTFGKISKQHMKIVTSKKQQFRENMTKIQIFSKWPEVPRRCLYGRKWIPEVLQMCFAPGIDI